MAPRTRNRRIEALLEQEKWDEARKLINKALADDPENHWLLTQLGVTYYEKRDYAESIRRFLSSLDIVSNCPLTLWNLAGALDAIGKPEAAVPIYAWLIRTNKSADDDPCWESKDWADALKTDCVYRLGLCFEHMNRRDSSEHCFRQYVNLLLAGMNGTYSMEDVARHIRDIHTAKKQTKNVRQAIDSTLQDVGIQSLLSGPNLPELSLDELLAP